MTSFVEKPATLRIQICCCVKDAKVPPCVLVSRSVSDASVHPSTFSLFPFFFAGLSMCKYCLIPPPSLSLSLSFSFPSPPSSLSFFINGPHSFPLTLCMPVCPPPPALCPPIHPPHPTSIHSCDFSCLYLSTVLTSPPRQQFPQTFIRVLSLSSICGYVSFRGFWYLDADLDVVISSLGNVHWHL